MASFVFVVCFVVKYVCEGCMGLPSLIADFVGFIRHERKWWMIPLVILLVILGLVSVFVVNSPVAPFIYTFF